MSFLELVKQRYSCRDYQAKAVEKEKLDYIMECVRLAPSAVNKQPWKFHFVTSEADKAKLLTCYRRDWLASAPMYIICSVLHDEEWVRFDGKPHGNIDIAIAVEHLCLAATEQGLATCWVCNAVEHLCLAATEQGLATCWVCNFDSAQCKELFALPESEEPAVIIPIGYAADELKEKKRKGLSAIC